jgi:hypothetical protein
MTRGVKYLQMVVDDPEIGTGLFPQKVVDGDRQGCRPGVLASDDN